MANSGAGSRDPGLKRGLKHTEAPSTQPGWRGAFLCFCTGWTPGQHLGEESFSAINFLPVDLSAWQGSLLHQLIPLPVSQRCCPARWLRAVAMHALTPWAGFQCHACNGPHARGKVFLTGAIFCSVQAVSKSKSPTQGTDKQNNVWASGTL